MRTPALAQSTDPPLDRSGVSQALRELLVLVIEVGHSGEVLGKARCPFFITREGHRQRFEDLLDYLDRVGLLPFAQLGEDITDIEVGGIEEASEVMLVCECRWQ